MIRKNCTYCSEPYQPENALFQMIPVDLQAGAKFVKGRGCEQCMNPGFVGRTAVTELRVVDQGFRDSVLQKLPTRSLQEVAIARGMQTMWQNGLKRVLQGQTTLEEILRVIAVDEI